MSEDTKDDAKAESEGSKFEMYVRGLSDVQLASAKATLDGVHGERSGPDVNSMGVGEFDAWSRQEIRKAEKAKA